MAEDQDFSWKVTNVGGTVGVEFGKQFDDVDDNDKVHVLGTVLLQLGAQLVDSEITGEWEDVEDDEDWWED